MGGPAEDLALHPESPRAGHDPEGPRGDPKRLQARPLLSAPLLRRIPRRVYPKRFQARPQFKRPARHDTPRRVTLSASKCVSGDGEVRSRLAPRA